MTGPLTPTMASISLDDGYCHVTDDEDLVGFDV